MKTVTMKKAFDWTIRVEQPKVRLHFAGRGRKTRFDDKRRPGRTAEKRTWQSEREKT